ncbi:hypothetical protein CYLTODRAFT_409195 [Cylindrobasidium torrendii FP15055 ss-10]|uniref:Uncharacterized protein n=1 Tax=Cylindrobasidium torrendii FP15055 ss-10 TaxID=1314674 RepID=A0A0D7BHL0_9AGAR|nr:hypothetical protein CYLTODRAFT_409195 [Cylindrobasidium torrendii FP15055 ss-10]
MFANAHRREELAWLQQRMAEELVPFDALSRARVVVAGLLASKAKHISQELVSIIGDKDFTEAMLWNLYYTFSWKENKVFSIPADIIRVFIQSRDKSYKPPQTLVNVLVQLQTDAGDLHAAYETVRDITPDGDQADPFHTAINALSSSDNKAADKWFEKVMDLANEKQIDGNTSLFNTLIAREVQRGTFSRAFAFYEALRDLHDTSGVMSPDYSTFRTMFQAVAKHYDPSSDSRPHGEDAPEFTPRHLFRDMVVLCFTKPETNRMIMDHDADLLNLAVKAFLAHGDYPAAFVALQYFTHIGLPVRDRIYKCIIEHVSLQLQLDAEFNQGRSWVPRFLGNLDAVTQRGLLHPNGVRPRKEYLLRSLAKPGHGVRYVVPTYEMMQGTKAIPESAALDLVPLHTCLSRALRADAHMQSNNPTIPEAHLKGMVDEGVERAEKIMKVDVPVRNWGSAPSRRGKR